MDHDQLRIHLDEDDEDDDDDEDDAELRTTRRHGRDDTETVTEASRGTIASSEPRRRGSRRGSRGGRRRRGARPAGLPDGRGAPRADDDGPLRTRHETRATRVREIGGEICPGRAPRTTAGPSPPTSGFSRRFRARARRRPCASTRGRRWNRTRRRRPGSTRTETWKRTGGFRRRGTRREQRHPWTRRRSRGRIRRRRRRRGRPPRTSRTPPPRARRRLRRLRAPPRCAPRARRTRARRTRSAFEDEPRRDASRAKKNGSRRLGRSSSSRGGVSRRGGSSGGSAGGTARARAAVAERLRLEGNERFRAGDFDGESRAYTEALAKRPGDPAALANRAAASIRLGAYADAAHDASECLRVEPGHRRRCGGARRRGGASGIIAARSEDLEALAEALPNNPGVAKDLAGRATPR